MEMNRYNPRAESRTGTHAHHGSGCTAAIRTPATPNNKTPREKNAARIHKGVESYQGKEVFLNMGLLSDCMAMSCTGYIHFSGLRHAAAQRKTPRN